MDSRSRSPARAEVVNLDAARGRRENKAEALTAKAATLSEASRAHTTQSNQRDGLHESAVAGAASGELSGKALQFDSFKSTLAGYL